LEAERQRLADHVERVAAQVSALPDKGSYMEACGALKKQQDTEVALSQQLQVGQRGQSECDASKECESSVQCTRCWLAASQLLISAGMVCNPLHSAGMPQDELPCMLSNQFSN
jgi:hypothetical protein